MKLSIIIPVFNAGQYLQHCLDCICSQVCEAELELCIVDDCSSDGSSEIIDAFEDTTLPARVSVKVIRHASNMGVAAARNSGLDAATGDYVCYVDADDILLPGALSTVTEICNDTLADIIGWDWMLSQEKGRRKMKQPCCPDPESALKSLMSGTMRWNLWLYAVRRNLTDGMRFIPGKNIGEDMMMTIGLMSRAGSFVQIPSPLYEYNQTATSISRYLSDDKLSQTEANINSLFQILENSRYSEIVNPYLSYLKLNAKLPLLVSLDKDDYIRWSQWFNEADHEIMSNRMLPFRTRLLQWLADRHLWGAVKIYNKLVYGFIYSIRCGK